MKRYRTIQVPIAFYRPGESMARSRCFITYEEPFGVVAHAPIPDPHRWAVDEYEVEDGFSGPVLRVRFRCVLCGETHHEEWRDEFPTSADFLPRTIFNWDGSPPVGAWM